MREGEWKRRKDKERKCYLEDLLEAYESYEPYIKFNKEKWKLKGLARIVYERKHIPELEYYEYYRQELKYFKLSNHVFKMCKECQRSRRYMKKLMIRIYEKKLIAIINMTYCCRVVFVMMFYGA